MSNKDDRLERSLLTSQINGLYEMQMTILKYAAAEERIHDIHRPGINEDEDGCRSCFQEYPCVTIRALEGEK